MTLNPFELRTRCDLSPSVVDTSNTQTIAHTSLKNEKKVSLKDAKPRSKVLEKSLLVTSVVFAAMSLVPPLRLAGALALRGVALLSSILNSEKNWKKDDLFSQIMNCSKIAIVALGIIALAVASPMLMVASLAADIGLQAIEMGRCIKKGEYTKALIHFGVMVIDTLALSAIAAGSWKLMVAAAAVSGFGMLILAIGVGAKAKNASDAIDVLSYAAFSAISFAGAFEMSEFWGNVKTKDANYDEARYFDSRGRPIQYPRKASYMIDHSKTEYFNNGERVLNPVHAEWDYQITQHALDPALFPTVPVGGPAIVTKELK